MISPDAGGVPPSWLDRLREAFGFKPSATLRQNLEQALSQEDALDAAFSPEERTLIRNILRLRETRVDDVMVPRADIDAVDVDTELSDLVHLFENSGHSRMPVYRETLDDAIGMVHIKDLMAYVTQRATRPAPPEIEGETTVLDLSAVDLSKTLAETELVRPVLFVPPSMPATDLLARMQAKRLQMALVIDEYGGTDGLVSIEDIVETIVGEIDDEHDVAEGPPVKAIAPGVWIADSRRTSTRSRVPSAPPSTRGVGGRGRRDARRPDLLAARPHPDPRRDRHRRDAADLEIEVLDADQRRIKTVRIVDNGHAAREAGAAFPRPPDRALVRRRSLDPQGCDHHARPC